MSGDRPAGVLRASAVGGRLRSWVQ
ncbi:hypothetical protein J2X52_001141 [Luteimonas sp. 3794]|nr:hypothetical protein [Luteimonas sp. 3794]